MSSRKEKLKQAILQGRIKDEKSALFFVLEEKKKSDLIKEVIAEIPEPIKGADGHTPTDKELLTLIKPLIEKIKPNDGKPGVDGKTPTEAQLKRLVASVMPDENLIADKVAEKVILPTIDKIEKNIPMLGEEIVDAINLLPTDNDEDKVDAIHIKNLPKLINTFGGGSPAGALRMDGVNSPMADINWGGYKITNLATPTADYDASTKKYVDDAVGIENLFDRTGTVLSPHTAGDSLDMGTGAITTTGLGTLGSLVVDTTTLVVNAVGYTDKVGIGTATPECALHVIDDDADHQLRLGYDATNYADFRITTTGSLVITPVLNLYTRKDGDATMASHYVWNNNAPGAGYGTGFQFVGQNLVGMALIASQWDAAANTNANLIFQTRSSGVLATRMTLSSAGNLTIGGGTAGVDYSLTFNGENSDGVITWMEDEDYFKFSDDIVLLDSEEIWLGTGKDFELYHDGTNSYIVNNTGDIYIENDLSNGDIFFKINDGGIDKTLCRIDGTAGGVIFSNLAAAATADVPLHAEISDAVTNTVSYPFRVTHITSSTPDNNIGVGIQFEVETAISNNEIGGTFDAVLTDKTATSEDFDFVWKLMAGGAAAAEKMRLTSLGALSMASITASSLTSGRIPFASTNGLLVDDGDLTFVTDTLTATKIVGTTSVKVGTAAGFISSDGSTGATGSFTTVDLKTVTVKDGIITSIV